MIQTSSETINTNVLVLLQRAEAALLSHSVELSTVVLLFLFFFSPFSFPPSGYTAGILQLTCFVNVCVRIGTKYCSAPLA